MLHMHRLMMITVTVPNTMSTFHTFRVIAEQQRRDRREIMTEPAGQEISEGHIL